MYILYVYVLQMEGGMEGADLMSGIASASSALLIYICIYYMYCRSKGAWRGRTS